MPSNLYEAFDIIYERLHGPGMDSFELILGSWANRKGYPLVTVSFNGQTNLLHINQKQFWSDPLQPKDDGTWWIPLNMVTMDNPEFNQTAADDRISLKGEASKSVHIDHIQGFNPDKWFIVNIQQTGYFRVNYDTNNWIRIIDQLQTDPSVIHVLNRAAMLDDIFVLSKTGDANYELAFSMATYLMQESDYIPWASALSHFDHLDRMIHSNKTSSNLMKFIAEIIQNAYTKLGTEENEEEEFFAKYARTLIITWACRVGIEDCLSKTQSMFAKMLYEDVEINVNIQSAVYCAALRESTNLQYFVFMSKLEYSDDQEERGRMIDALGCANDENKLMAFLKSSLAENELGYREAEKPRVILSVLKGNKYGVSSVIKFYHENFEQFLGKYD